MGKLLFFSIFSLLSWAWTQQFPEENFNSELAVAQFAISHGHCGLLANANVNEFDVRVSKEEYSDILINFSIDMNTLKSFNK